MRLTDLSTVLREIYKSGEWENHDQFQNSILVIFPQIWGSTAMGFVGIGGSAMTPAWTTVLRGGVGFDVYFNARFAYSVRKDLTAFKSDLDGRQLRGVADAVDLYGADLT